MLQVYGTIPLQNEGDAVESIWCSRWRVIIQHIGNHYILPGGPIGHRYVETLAEEISHLTVGNFSSDHVLVFSSVILQRDRTVRKGANIRRGAYNSGSRGSLIYFFKRLAIVIRLSVDATVMFLMMTPLFTFSPN